MAQTGYSRFPVSGPDGATWSATCTSRTSWAPGRRAERTGPRRRLRDLATVGSRDDVEDVVAVMQRTGAHLARVVEPHGQQVVGVVFLEDMLEQLVGEVRDASRRTP